MADLVIDKFEKEFTLIEKYFPIIEKNLPKHEKELFTHIAKYRDKNMQILSSPYLLNYPVFSVKDEQIIFDVCNINIVELKKDSFKVKLHSGISVSAKSNFEPFQILILMMMRYYMINKEDKKLRILYYYMAYSMYWTLYKKYFKKFLPREETMIYTIDNLSNKFILKQFKSIDALLFYAIQQATQLHWDRLISGSDGEISYIIDACKTKLNNYINKIFNEYMINYHNNEVTLKGDDTLEDGGQRDSSSLAGDVEMLAQEYTTKFFSSPPRLDIIDKIAKLKGVSSSELKITLTLLIDSQNIAEVKNFYDAIFYLFLSDDNMKDKNIKSLAFLGIMESIYKKGNSSDKNIATIKSLMNKWLEKGSATYRATNRLATQNVFRKAIYYYFIFLVTWNK